MKIPLAHTLHQRVFCLRCLPPVEVPRLDPTGGDIVGEIYSWTANLEAGEVLHCDGCHRVIASEPESDPEYG